MNDLELEAHESMFVLDGGPDAALPEGSGGPVLAGPEAIFIAGRVAADAPTRVRIGSSGSEGGLVRAYVGRLATPARRLRVVKISGDVLAEIEVDDDSTEIEIFLTDLTEPDEIFIALGA